MKREDGSIFCDFCHKDLLTLHMLLVRRSNPLELELAFTEYLPAEGMGPAIHECNACRDVRRGPRYGQRR